MRLNSLVTTDSFLNPFHVAFLNVIESTVDNLSRIQFLASDLINFHLLRLLTLNLPLPTFNQTFFGRCCIIVTDTARDNKDSELLESFNQFRSLYPDYVVPRNNHMGHHMSSLARQMMVNFDNHIALNIASRVIRYVRFKYNLTRSASETFIKQCFTTGVILSSDQVEFKAWCIHYPLDPLQINKHTAHFVTLSFQILKYLEDLEEGTKGRKLFTLAPIKGDFIRCNITINSITMINLFALLTSDNRLDLLYSLDV